MQFSLLSYIIIVMWLWMACVIVDQIALHSVNTLFYMHCVYSPFLCRIPLLLLSKGQTWIARQISRFYYCFHCWSSWPCSALLVFQCGQRKIMTNSGTLDMMVWLCKLCFLSLCTYVCIELLLVTVSCRWSSTELWSDLAYIYHFVQQPNPYQLDSHPWSCKIHPGNLH